jgi:hypothetical protein
LRGGTALDDAWLVMHRLSPRSALAGLVRQTWLVTAITVISCAGLAARGAASILAADDGEPAPRPAAPVVQPAPRARVAPASERRRAGGDQLVFRNMFCSSCGPLEDTGGRVSIAFTQALLIETSIGAEPRATVRVLTSEVQGSWGLGETIPGLGQIERIAYQWIEVIDGAGHHGRLSLVSSADPAAGRGPEPASSESPPAAAWAQRLRKIDDQTYEVERGLVRDLVSGVAKADGVRPVPILENGEIKGIKLYGVTPASIPFALGLRSGDSLTAIDGEPIKNIQQLLDLYARLDSTTTVELTGKHASKPLARTLRLH